MAKQLRLNPGKAALNQLESVYRTPGDLVITINSSARARVDKAASIVRRAAGADQGVYGVNTGFGKLASTRIAAEQTAQLQRNLILSHCCGVGEPLPDAIVRLTMVLKILSLGRGASGVRWQIIKQLQAFLNNGISPVIPEQGSVGASGDLAPLAHLTAALIGEGEVFYAGRRIKAATAMKKTGLAPIALGPKEGRGMINGHPGVYRTCTGRHV